MDDSSRAFELRHLEETLQFAARRGAEAAEDLKRLEALIEALQPQVSTENPEALGRFQVAQDMAGQTETILKNCRRAADSPYFGRVDFQEDGKPVERLYLGRAGLYDEDAQQPVVVDWRTPAASLYYDGEPGPAGYLAEDTRIRGILHRKRTYSIAGGQLLDCYDADLVTSDALLQAYLAKNASSVLKDIVATIQKDQNTIIRIAPWKSVIVQGVAGSGKTTVALHRLAYLIFNYADIRSSSTYAVIGSNRMFLGYIAGMLPDLGVEGIRQLLMPELFREYLGQDESCVPLREDAVLRSSAKTFFAIRDRLDALERELLCHEVTLGGRVLVDVAEIDRILFGGRKKSLERKVALFHQRLNVRIRETLPRLERRIEERYDRALQALKAGADSPYASPGELIDAKYAELEGLKAEAKALKSLYKRQAKAWKPEKIYKSVLESLGSRAGKKRDLYDLAALSYITQRLYTRASPLRHIVVDEAQDFGPLLYLCMTEVFDEASFTILGDLSQNIGDGVGILQWEEILDTAFRQREHCFSVLSKSYRNTVEIAQAANRVLAQLGPGTYPSEPVVRHGDPVEYSRFAEWEALLDAAVQEAAVWQSGSLALICPDAESAAALHRRIPHAGLLISGEEEQYVGGVTVFDAGCVKGLEFDRVVVCGASLSAYPATPQGIRRLYVVLTRALHSLRLLLEAERPSLLEA